MRPAVVFSLLAAFLGLIAAYVVLTLHGHDGDKLVMALIPLLGAVGVAIHGESRHRSQVTTLAKIDRQTNGVLTARIRDGATAAVEDVLNRAGIPVPKE